MASKRKQTDLSGFITTISPRKEKSVRFGFQVGSEICKKAILFDMRKFKTIKEKHQSCEAVKILNCVVNETTTSNFAEIVVNSDAIIVEPQPNDVVFKREEPKLSTIALSTINESKIGQLVSVKGKVVIDVSAERKVFAYGKYCRVADNNFIVDQSGSMKLTFWEQWIDYFNGKSGSFELYNFAVKKFDDNIYLTTCSDSFVQAIPDDDNFNFDVPVIEDQVQVKELDSIGKFKYSLLCGKCKKGMQPSDNLILICEFCGTSQRCASTAKQVLIPLSCNELDGTWFISYKDYVVYDSSVQCDDIFTVNQKGIVEKLLSLKNITFVLDREKHLLRFMDENSDAKAIKVTRKYSEVYSEAGRSGHSSGNQALLSSSQATTSAHSSGNQALSSSSRAAQQSDHFSGKVSP